jgi:hypothetical protein
MIYLADSTQFAGIATDAWLQTVMQHFIKHFSKMKLSLLALTIYLFTLNAICQNSNSSIIGKWKVSVVSSENIYYDVQKDSLWFSKEFKLLYKNDLKYVAEIVREMYQNTIYFYKKNGIYIQVMGNVRSRLMRYKTDKKYRVIRILDYDDLRVLEKKTKYYIEHNRLHYTLFEIDYFGKTKFVLEKI